MFEATPAKTVGVGMRASRVRIHRVDVLIGRRASEVSARVFGIGREELGERGLLFRNSTRQSRSTVMLAEYDSLETLAVIAVHVSAANDVVDDLVHEALECGRAMRVEYDGARVKGRLQIGQILIDERAHVRLRPHVRLRVDCLLVFDPS